MISITTEKPGQLFLDSMPAKKMTIYHHIMITGIDPGYHVLSFKYDSVKIQQKILITTGRTDYYVVRPDSVVLSETKPGRVIKGTRSSVRSYYIPKEKGLYCLANVGFSASGGSSYFNGNLIAGYQFSPLLSLGGGIGFLKFNTSFNSFTFILLASNSIVNSTRFSVPCIPLFIDIRLNLSRKMIVPYFSADLGCSLPVLPNAIDGEYDESWNSIFGDSDEHYHFHISKINPGFYLAVNPGLKVFVQGKYYIDLSMGVDLSFNKITGTKELLPTSSSSGTSGTISTVKTLSCFHMNVGFGF